MSMEDGMSAKTAQNMHMTKGTTSSTERNAYKNAAEEDAPRTVTKEQTMTVPTAALSAARC